MLYSGPMKDEGRVARNVLTAEENRPKESARQPLHHSILFIVLIAFLLRLAVITHGPHLPDHASPRSFSIWLGDGAHRPLDRRRPGIQFAHGPFNRAKRMGAAALSLYSWRSLQVIRCVQRALGLGDSQPSIASLLL